MMLAALLFTFQHVSGHGRLTVPLTRKAVVDTNSNGYENDPVPGFADTTFVCRNDLGTVATTLTAGTTLNLKWNFGAAHVGDCAVFISYDINAATKADQEYFKIANLFDCKSQNNVDVPIDLPSWLPSGQAVLRWDWYALHQYPNVEFYSQCSDVTIVPTGSALTIGDLTTYSIISPPIYPQNGNTGVGYRNPFNPTAEQFMTGPNCANGFTGNSCGLSASGTTGYVDVGDLGNPVMAPTPVPTIQGDTPTPPPTLKPECVTYTVVTGDTLTAIATAFTNDGKTVTSSEICSFNNLQDCSMIDVGDSLMIPCETCGCGGDPQGVTDIPLSAAQTEIDDLKSQVSTLTVVIVFLVLGMIVLCIAASPSHFVDRTTRFKNTVVEKTSKKDPAGDLGTELPKVEKEKDVEKRRATVTKTSPDDEGNQKPVAWAV